MKDNTSCLVGLISGTSMDGIDAVVVSLPHQGQAQPTQTLDVTWLAAETFPFSSALTDALGDARQHAEQLADDGWDQPWVHALNHSLAEAFAQAAMDIIALAGITPSDVHAIGSHGQTIAHRPDAKPPFSLQLGDPQTIANRTHITTVGRFRQADLEAGGQGAPLAPLLHQALFEDASNRRAVINLGGIGNVTLLRPGQEVIGFDTGPANVLLDLFYRQHHPGQGRHDPHGQWASSGKVIPKLLAACQQDLFFQQAPPKSTGVEYFGKAWLTERLHGFVDANANDIQATLAELTAATIADALGAFEPIDEVICCGGGIHNHDLLQRLARRLPNALVSTSNDWSMNADHLEGLLFAWLAHQRLANHAFDTTSITGAKHPVLLGEVFVPNTD